MLRDAPEMFWKRPGFLPGPVTALVALACTLLIVAVLVGGNLLWTQACRGYCSIDYDDGVGLTFERINRWSLLYGLAIGVASWIAVSFLPPFRWSRWVRVAVLLPVVPLIVLAVAWNRWPVIAPLMPRRDAAPLLDAFPIAPMLVAVIAWTAFAGWLACRRAGDWIHATVMVALVNLLLVGLWLPIAAWLRSRDIGPGMWNDDYHGRLLAPGAIAALVLSPPIAVSLGYTALAMRWPDAARKTRRYMLVGLAAITAASLTARFKANYGSGTVYINFIHVLLAFAVAAAGALGMLAGGLVLAARRDRRILATDPLCREGTIALDDPKAIVAQIEIASWLHGPRAAFRSCVVATARGDIAIDDARIIAAVPPLSTHLAIGDSIELLRAGDPVMIAGLVPPPAGHPFRDSTALVPGPDGVILGDPARLPRGFANVALAMWRPCLAYLGILMALVAIGLAGA
jgi:hypothetical protein